MKLASIFAIFCLSSTCFADDLPKFQNDMAADAWLRQNVAGFKGSSGWMDKRGGYEYTSGTTSSFLGFHYNETGKLCIELPKDLKGAARLTRLLQHWANAGHAPRYKLVDTDVLSGKLVKPDEFVKRYLDIYWEAMADCGLYLAELQKTVGPIPKESLSFSGASPAIVGEMTPEEFIRQQPKVNEFLQAKFTELKSSK